jgi:phage gp36-like protein
MPIVYASLADMQARHRPEDLLELSDWDGNDVMDAGRIERALADAGALIDGYVARRHGDRSGLPVPPLLVKVACDIAFHMLFRATPPEGVQKSYDAAIRTLRDIADGRVKLDEGNVDALPTRPGAIHMQGRKRFTRDELDSVL